MSALWPMAFCLGGSLFGCHDLDDFRTQPGEVFRGMVVGSASVVADETDEAGAEAGTTAESQAFLLYGFEAGTVLDLTFDPDAVSQSLPGEVGTLEIYRCLEETPLACSEEAREAAPLGDVRLQVIPGLSQDVLSRYEFPGASRLRSFILHGVSQSAEESSRVATVFLSLMESGDIELRVVAPEMSDQYAGLFGLFRLARVRE